MGGTSTQQGAQAQAQNTNQSQTQTTTPWGPAGATVSGILGNLQGINPNLTDTQSGAINQLIALGSQGNPFTGGITNTVNSLLSGGGAAQYAPMVSDAYSNLQQQLSPFTDPNNLNPLNTPGISQALQTATSDISNTIKGQYAGAGREPSGAASFPQTEARGLAQGLAPILTGQYNQNVSNLMNAGSTLFGAGNTAANTLLGINQTGLGNQQQGITDSSAATAAQQYGPLLQLQAAAQQTGIPLQTLAGMMGIGLPAASAFGTTSGTGTGASTSQGQTNQTNQMSGAQQFALLASGLGSLMGKGAQSPGGSGLLGNLGQFGVGWPGTTFTG